MLEKSSYSPGIYHLRKNRNWDKGCFQRWSGWGRSHCMTLRMSLTLQLTRGRSYRELVFNSRRMNTEQCVSWWENLSRAGKKISSPSSRIHRGTGGNTNCTVLGTESWNCVVEIIYTIHKMHIWRLCRFVSMWCNLKCLKFLPRDPCCQRCWSSFHLAKHSLELSRVRQG